MPYQTGLSSPITTTALTNFTNYRSRVRARGPGGNSDWTAWSPLQKVGLPPTITVQPTNQTAASGATATFTATSTGTATITYQWQSNTGTAGAFVNIAAATTAGYTTPALVVGDSGRLYRRVDTNGAGTATTASASVTVTSAVTFSDAFPEADGSALNTAKWSDTSLGGTSTVSVQTGQAQFVAQGASYTYAKARTVHAAEDNFDLVCTITTTSTGESYVTVGFRASTTGTFWRAGTSNADPNNGYGINHDVVLGTLSLYKVVAGTPTSLATNVTLAATTNPRKIKVQCNGTAIRVRSWIPPAAEPATWLFDIVDTTYTAGVETFGIVNDAIARTLLLDDVTVTAI